MVRTVVRVVIGLWGLANIVAGLVVVAAGQAAGLFAVGMGAVALGAVAFERARYESEASERTRLLLEPRGGDDGTPPPPFQPTGELFVDPTTRRKMRVYLDPSTGERRYHAEG